MKFLKMIMVLVLASLWLVACGGDTATEAEVEEPETAAETVSEAETDDTAAEAEVEEPETAAETVAEAEADDSEEMAEEDDGGAFPMTITHDFGEVTFEKPPERIVAISPNFLEMAVALDVPVVAVGWVGLPPTEDGGLPPLPQMAKPILGDPVYFNDEMPNREALLALNADLIMRDALGVEGDEDPNHDLMNEVAPTLSYSFSISEPGAWVDIMRDFGRIVGKSEQAEEVIAEYETQSATLVEEAAPLAEAAPEIAMIYGGPDFVGMIGSSFAIGGLIETLGFTLVVPDSVEMPPTGIIDVSPEILDQIEADTIILWKFVPDAPILGEELLDVLDTPILTLNPVPGVGFTGPNSEIFYMTNILEAFQAEYES